METFEEEIEGTKWSCQRIRAFYALELLSVFQSIFPASLMGSGKVEAMDWGKGLRDVDHEVLGRFLKLSDLKREGVDVRDLDDFDTLQECMYVIGWICDITYMEALSRPQLEIPTELQDPDKYIAFKEAMAEGAAAKPKVKKKVQGVMPVNLHHWVYMVVSMVDKSKRVDWLLLEKLKKEYDLVTFFEIWEALQASQSWETAHILSSMGD